MALFSSAILLDELVAVLERDKFSALLAAQEITPALLMQRYGLLTTVVKPEPIGRTVPSDEDDDHVIATALSAQADAIATGDRDLLGLHPYRTIRILSPADTLRYVEASRLSAIRKYRGERAPSVEVRLEGQEAAVVATHGGEPRIGDSPPAHRLARHAIAAAGKQAFVQGRQPEVEGGGHRGEGPAGRIPAESLDGIEEPHYTEVMAGDKRIFGKNILA